MTGGVPCPFAYSSLAVRIHLAVKIVAPRVSDVRHRKQLLNTKINLFQGSACVAQWHDTCPCSRKAPVQAYLGTDGIKHQEVLMVLMAANKIASVHPLLSCSCKFALFYSLGVSFACSC